MANSYPDRGDEEVKAPPASEVGIRTMASDIAAIERSGGQMTSQMALEKAAEVDSSQEVSVGEEAEAPRDLSSLVFEPGTEMQPPEGNSSRLKLVIIIVAVFVLGFASALIGYFVIFPWFLK